MPICPHAFQHSYRVKKIFFPSLLYYTHEPNSDALKMEEAISSKTPEKIFHIRGVQPFHMTKGHHTRCGRLDRGQRLEKYQ